MGIPTFSTSSAVRVALTLAVALVSIALLGNGCAGGGEGDRCNPNLSHNECDNGLTCVQPSTCAESYCCPSDPAKSSNGYCNGSLCPQPEGGTDAGTDVAADAPPG